MTPFLKVTAPEKLAIRLALDQQAANQLRGDHLCWATEEGVREGLGKGGGYGSGLGERAEGAGIKAKSARQLYFPEPPEKIVSVKQ